MSESFLGVKKLSSTPSARDCLKPKLTTKIITQINTNGTILRNKVASIYLTPLGENRHL